jgi:non-ribosomal peptide synthetase-like protein
VLDIGTALDDGSQLAHASSLTEGQTVPAGRRYHGSPAEESSSDLVSVEPRRCSSRRRAVYAGSQLAGRFLFEAPLLVAFIALALFIHVENVGASLLMYFGTLGFGLLTTLAIPRVLRRFVVAEETYRLYGFRFWAYQSILGASNSPLFNNLFGDSSYVVNYLRGIGVDLSDVEQTGSNFGVSQKHDVPSLSHVGRGTMVSDGISMVSVDFSSSSFRLADTRIGADNFLGNDIVYPAQSRVGDNCLLATKVMVPIDGELRENVGLLGSPPFEIPRSVRRDAQFDAVATGDERTRRLKRKNRSNLATMALYLASRWLFVYAAVLIAQAAVSWHAGFDQVDLAIGLLGVLVFTVAYYVLVEKCSLGFRRLRPQYCSIYEPYFWSHERYWKLNGFGYIAMFDGTPFKNVIWRLLGVRLGKKVFDNGCAIVEKTLAEIGDYCTLGEGATLQSHSLEDATFKSDFIKIGNGCTVGTNAFVHYGVEVGDGVVLRADSFLMKGESPRPNSMWGGNPAREVHAVADVTAGAE